MDLHDRPLIEQMAVGYATEIERLNAEVARLQRERDQIELELIQMAERNEQLRAALEEIAKLDAHINPGVYIARNALANEEGK